MNNIENNYKAAKEALISSQELLIIYARREVASSVLLGCILVLIAIPTSGTPVWLSVFALLLAGMNFHTAVNEHRQMKVYQLCLDELKEITPGSKQDEDESKE